MKTKHEIILGMCLTSRHDYGLPKENVRVDGEMFPNVQFYDYTKVLGRKVKAIANYHLTFSAADGNDDDVNKAIQQGYNIATVFGIKKTLPMPETYKGLPVFNGDDSDLRFLDPKGVVVGLYAKGKAKKDTSGFVKFPVMMMKVA